MSDNDKTVYPTHFFLSISQLNKFDRCQRMYYYTYIQALYGEPTKSLFLEFGSKMHELVEKSLIYHSKHPELSEEYIKNEFYMQSSDYDFDKKTPTLAGRTIKVMNTVKTIIKQYELISTEFFIQLPVFSMSEFDDDTKQMFATIMKRREKEGVLEDDLTIGGYVDAYMIERHTKRYTVLDWKTGIYKREKIDIYARQIQLYVYIMRQLGYDVDRAVVYFLESDMEVEVDVSERTCQEVFSTIQQSFRNIIHRKDRMSNFERVDDQYICGSCQFNYLCYDLPYDMFKLESLQF